ncbi:hypothetical protein J6590_090186 [Homalodisca vitripennis]|nr:hypothetical protein J6590_090186 [Homalodisca vitripennis]
MGHDERLQTQQMVSSRPALPKSTLSSRQKIVFFQIPHKPSIDHSFKDFAEATSKGYRPIATWRRSILARTIRFLKFPPWRPVDCRRKRLKDYGNGRMVTPWTGSGSTDQCTRVATTGLQTDRSTADHVPVLGHILVIENDRCHFIPQFRNHLILPIRIAGTPRAIAQSNKSATGACVPAGVAIPCPDGRRGGCGVGEGGNDEAGQYPCVPICRAQLTVTSDKQLKYQ